MHAELVVPGLFSAARQVRAPAAELLLARGRRRDSEACSLEDWLKRAFQLEDGPLPVGALTLLARDTAPPEGLWARADPVHLRLMRDHVVLVPGSALSIAREEAAALTDSLNRHFGARLELRADEPLRWTARLAEPLALAEEPPLAHAGRVLHPGSPGARPAESLITEIQMLLHAHPVNEAREARGEPTVNSLWLWGAGPLPRDAAAPWQSISAEDPLPLGLARAAKRRGFSPSVSAQAWLERLPEDGRHLVLLDALRVPVALRDESAATAAFVALEHAWFAPLLEALRSGRIGMVTVHVPDGESAVSFETIHGDLRRFWRRRRPVSAYQE